MIETIVRNFTIERILYILRKRWIIVVLFATIGAAMGGVYAQSMNKNLYRARITFYMYSRGDYTVDSDAYVSSSDFTYATRLINSYTLVLKSNSVLEKVIEASGTNYTSSELSAKISHSVEKDTAMFYVYVSDTDPYQAMILANTLAEVAPEEVTRIVKSGGISVVDNASLPTTPYATTNVLKYIIIGAAGGFAVPLIIVLFAGLLDTTIRKKSELESLFEIPIIGNIPEIPVGTKKKPIQKILNDDSPFAIEESYNELCTNLLYTTQGERCPVYVVTSAIQNEGKSLTSINIAKGLSKLGKRTLLIDADLRNASVARYLGVADDNDEGLSQYLAAITDNKKIVKIDERFDVMFAGKQPPNPAELIAGKRFELLLSELKEKYDFIFVDVPPLGIVSDAMLLKNNVVGYILVVRSEYTKMTDELNIVKKFENTEANITGFVFNGSSSKSTRVYNKYYGYDNKK